MGDRLNSECNKRAEFIRRIGELFGNESVVAFAVKLFDEAVNQGKKPDLRGIYTECICFSNTSLLKEASQQALLRTDS